MITAEELLEKYQKEFDENGIVFDLKKPMIEFARLHTEAALLKAKEMYLLNEANMSECPLYLADTIINAYPKELVI